MALQHTGDRQHDDPRADGKGFRRRGDLPNMLSILSSSILELVLTGLSFTELRISSDELHAYICTGSLTTTFNTAVFPFEVATVISAVPGFFAVTYPFAFTSATLRSLLVKVTLLA